MEQLSELISSDPKKEIRSEGIEPPPSRHVRMATTHDTISPTTFWWFPDFDFTTYLMDPLRQSLRCFLLAMD